MIPHIQTFVGNGDKGSTPGNCMQAAVAALLDMPLEQVPHFALFGNSWGKSFSTWLEVEGKEIRVYNDWDEHRQWWAEYGVSSSRLDQAPTDQVLVATGRSLNGPWGHSVLWRAGEIVHDPHPSKRGLDGAPYEFWRITDANQEPT